MQYFVTGATGFIGKRLVKKLLARKGAVVHFLIRKESEGKVAALREYWGVSTARALPVFGDLTSKKLGVVRQMTSNASRGRSIIFTIWPLCTTWEPTRPARSPSTSMAPATRWNLRQGH
jgi:thioester reductase-like protein